MADLRRSNTEPLVRLNVEGKGEANALDHLVNCKFVVGVESPDNRILCRA